MMLNDLNKLKQAILYANKGKEKNSREAEDVTTIQPALSNHNFSSATSMAYQLVDALPHNPEKNTIYGLRNKNGKVTDYIWLDNGYQKVTYEASHENRDDLDSLLYAVVQTSLKDDGPAIARLGSYASMLNCLPPTKK